MKYHIKDGKPVFDVRVGNLDTGEELTLDEIRQVAILNSRFADGRPLEGRPLIKLRGGAREIIAQRAKILDEEAKEIEDLKQQLHNSGRVIEMLQDRVNDLTQESNEWRIRFIEASGALSKLQEGS
jgi:hypothetical protein